MKIKNILLLTLFLIALSCNKEEVLNASSNEIASEEKFPENTPFDAVTTEIYRKFDVKLMWTKVQNKDLNRNWVTDEISGAKKCYILSEDEAGESINFLSDHIFSKIDLKFFNKVLKPNVYIIKDLHKLAFGMTLFPITYDLEGMDCWLFSFFGEGVSKYPSYPKDVHYLPVTDKEILSFRVKLFGNLFLQLLKNEIIEVPSKFITDFDYNTQVKYNPKDAGNLDFYMNRGFCGKYNTLTGTLGQLAGIKSANSKDNLISYMYLIATYSKEDIENGVGINGVPFNNYPIILENYDFVDNYFRTKYGYDIKQIHKF